MFDDSNTNFEWYYDLLNFMTNCIVDGYQTDNGKTELDFLHEKHYDNFHRISETVADRSAVGLPKPQAFGLRGLHRSNIITAAPLVYLTSH